MGVPFLARQWLSRAWYQIVGSDDPRHLRAGTQVQRCKSTRKALSYAAKYVAKISTCAPVQHVGRFGASLDEGTYIRVSYSGRLTVEDMRDCLALFATWLVADPSRLLAPGTALDGVLRTVELECAVLYAAGMTWEPTAAA